MNLEKPRSGKTAFNVSRTLAVAVILAAVACGGGGGGGGGGNPVAPPPITPPPPGQVSGNLQGSVVGFPDTTLSFLGAEAILNGSTRTTINADNRFGFQNVPPGVHRLEFTGSNFVTRRVRVEVRAGGTNHFDDLDLVQPEPFNLSAYDEIYRSFSVPGIVRWKNRPSRIVLDKSSLGSMPQGFSFFERHVKDAYNNWLPRNTNGFFQGTQVVTGSVDPSTPETFDCDQVREGDIVILAVDECDQNEEFITLGTTTHCFDTVGNEVILGAIWFNPCTTESTIDHEIIHTLCAGHLENQPNLSIMAPFGGPDQITQLDRLHMQYTYNRPLGTLSPDDAWQEEPLQPVIR
jgi:hypothetical protein